MTPHNIKQLKRLNQVIFPVSYNDKFYKDVLEVGELAKLGKNTPIASVTCPPPCLFHKDIREVRELYF